MVKGARRSRRIRVNQLVRFENEEAINLDLACEWAVSLANGLRQVTAIDLSLAPRLAGSIQSRVALNWERQALRGLHLRKVALITGGSEGIGGEAARLLALAGARVAIAARSLEKLEKARRTLIEELTLAGYSDPEARVLIIPDCDVGEERALEQMVEQTLVRFGRIDFLINNAGIAGAEQMVADMPLELWDRTLLANLTSNYDLIMRVLPHMKKRGSGHILNVSSHFGGVRNGTVAYPNRSDYAVSKAGQRAMAEVMAGMLGPDVQINAVAPGPVDGVRLRGSKDRPGLYARRAKLILEMKRMNLVYGALVTVFRCGEDMSEALAAVAKNDLKALTASGTPEALRVLAKNLLEKPPKESCGSATRLLTRALAVKLLARLSLGRYLPPGFSEDRFFTAFVEAPEPFMPQSQIDADAQSIKASVLSTLALQRMPSENDVAREMVFYLANRNITGETLHPSCGLMLERLTMSGDFVGRAHPDLMNELRDQTIALVGGSMHEEMASLAAAYVRAGVKAVAVVTKTEEGRRAVEDALKASGIPTTAAAVTCDSSPAAEALDKVIAKVGQPDVVLSFPLSAISLPQARTRNAWEALPPTATFKRIVADNITNHLALGKRASLIDGCRVVFVTPRLSAAATGPTAAMVNFIRTTLRPLTVTAGQEGARLVHKPTFNQIDTTAAGDITRFVEAVLLMSLPQPASGAEGSARAASGATITI
jgi:malonyl-CoA reductase/3-hydroxypropionate dehydrogenase (NADP+)